jgi:transcriptional regulator with XRE-family HTH domain
LNARDRSVATLVASGLTTQEIASRLGVSASTVDRARALDDVKAVIDQLERDGIPPQDVLRALMSSKNENTSLRAASELSKITEAINCPDPSAHTADSPLPEGVERIVTRTRSDGTTSVREYPLPPFEDPKGDEYDAELDRLAEAEFGDPKAHTLEHFQAASDLVYPRAE